MATEVLTGYFAKVEDFTLYSNNTGQNVRLIFNYLSIEGSGTNEVRIITPAQTNQTPSYDDQGNAILVETSVPASYVQLPNLPDADVDWIEGIIGKQLSSSGLNYGWYYRQYWKFDRNKDFGGDNQYGYMFLTSSKELSGKSYELFGGDKNWWKKYGRTMEIPFPVEYYLKPNQSLVFVGRKIQAKGKRKGELLPLAPQQITYNVLVMTEGGC